MTVYVDNYRREATVGRLSARWSHLFTGPWDDPGELHELAAAIRLLPAWFQDKPWPHGHYDVTDGKRRLAIAAGAVPVSCRDMGKLMSAARRRGQGNPPPACEAARWCPPALEGGGIRVLTLRPPWPWVSLGGGILLPDVAAAACALARAAVLGGVQPCDSSLLHGRTGARMPRLMSVALTTPQVIARSKTVTRRDGWRFLKPGDRLTLCPKVMGFRRGEHPEHIADVEVLSVRRERLDAITAAEVTAEGFPGQTPAWFIGFFCDSHKGCTPESIVTRIEWRYLGPLPSRQVPHPEPGVVTGRE